MWKLLKRLLRTVLLGRRQIEIEDIWARHQAEWIITAQRVEAMRREDIAD